MKPDFLGFQVDKDVVVIMDGVGICIGAFPSSLKILSTHKAPVDIDVG